MIDFCFVFQDDQATMLASRDFIMDDVSAYVIPIRYTPNFSSFRMQCNEFNFSRQPKWRHLVNIELSWIKIQRWV
jgi:hypothetical protein